MNLFLLSYRTSLTINNCDITVVNTLIYDCDLYSFRIFI